jgi:hypothetical protein
MARVCGVLEARQAQAKTINSGSSGIVEDPWNTDVSNFLCLLSQMARKSLAP